jgi:hypothetical protein
VLDEAVVVLVVDASRAAAAASNAAGGMKSNERSDDDDDDECDDEIARAMPVLPCVDHRSARSAQTTTSHLPRTRRRKLPVKRCAGSSTTFPQSGAVARC